MMIVRKKMWSVIVFVIAIQASYSYAVELDDLGLDKTPVCLSLLLRTPDASPQTIGFSGKSLLLGETARAIAARAVELVNRIVPSNFKKPAELSVFISDGPEGPSMDPLNASIDWVIYRNGATPQSNFVAFVHEYAHVLFEHALMRFSDGRNRFNMSRFSSFVYQTCHELFADSVAVAITGDGKAIYNCLDQATYYQNPRRRTQLMTMSDSERASRDFTIEYLLDGSAPASYDPYSALTPVRRFLWSGYFDKADVELNKKVIAALLNVLTEVIFSGVDVDVRDSFGILSLQNRIIEKIEKQLVQ